MANCERNTVHPIILVIFTLFCNSWIPVFKPKNCHEILVIQYTQTARHPDNNPTKFRTHSPNISSRKNCLKLPKIHLSSWAYEQGSPRKASWSLHGSLLVVRAPCFYCLCFASLALPANLKAFYQTPVASDYMRPPIGSPWTILISGPCIKAELASQKAFKWVR